MFKPNPLRFKIASRANEKTMIQGILEQTIGCLLHCLEVLISEINHSFSNFTEPCYVLGSLLDTNNIKINKT